MMRMVCIQNKTLYLLLITLAVAGAAIPGHAQQDMLRLRLNVGTVSLNKLVNWVAYEEGLYKKNGLDVQQGMSRSGAADIKKLTGYDVPSQYILGDAGPYAEAMTPDGRNPISIGGGSPNIVRQVTTARTIRTVIILTTEDKTRWPIIARKDITKPEQLKGKRLGYTNYGTTSHYQATLFAKRMGWDPIQDISLMGGVSYLDPLRDLRDGVIDAFVSGEMATYKAIGEGYKLLVETTKWNEPMASNGVNVDRAWLQNNREVARRLVKSMVEAIAMMKKDKQVAYRAMAKYYGIAKPEAQAYFYAQVENMPSKPYPAVAGIKKTLEVFQSVAGNEIRKHKPEDFYDDSFVRELDEIGYIDSLYE
ncbi:MAG: ABC transporter substrate-binding protein [Acidobacteria bacterium]|nr:ABC transporter substrate-binding protein [Acidobacteriota bacterium]